MKAEPEWDTAEVKREGAKDDITPDAKKLALGDDNSEQGASPIETDDSSGLRVDQDRPSREAGSTKKRPVTFRRPRAKRRARTSDNRLISPLTRKILAVNFIAVLIPVAGFLSLGQYRDSLIETELEALKTQGEVFAGAIGEGAIATTLSGDQVLDIPPAQQIVRRLSESNAVRARLFLPDGELAADSRLLVAGGGIIHIQ
ncbi:MAG: sensor N-terminal transmembrane domain-containing protein, partial [Alphaproteobacteria bacterium]|nr:sensor N-terminal transmembrane domain-containing protein [Alphaproteobacteria bacterium]